MSGSGVHHATSGQQNGFGDPHGPLMRQECIVGPAGVPYVLVDIDDLFSRVPGSLRSRQRRAREE